MNVSVLQILILGEETSGEETWLILMVTSLPVKWSMMNCEEHRFGENQNMLILIPVVSCMWFYFSKLRQLN